MCTELSFIQWIFQVKSSVFLSLLLRLALRQNGINATQMPSDTLKLLIQMLGSIDSIAVHKSPSFAEVMEKRHRIRQILLEHLTGSERVKEYACD